MQILESGLASFLVAGSTIRVVDTDQVQKKVPSIKFQLETSQFFLRLGVLATARPEILRAFELLLLFGLLDGIFRELLVFVDEFVCGLDVLELITRVFLFELVEFLGECLDLLGDAIGGAAKGVECFLRAGSGKQLRRTWRTDELWQGIINGSSTNLETCWTSP
jgi:hypothetical protein